MRPSRRSLGYAFTSTSSALQKAITSALILFHLGRRPAFLFWLVADHMTPHQFRHFGATSYLEEHPEDFETVRAMLGHAWSKTTLIYAGSSSRRASRAYNQYLFQQREALKLQRSRRKRVR